MSNPGSTVDVVVRRSASPVRAVLLPVYRGLPEDPDVRLAMDAAAWSLLYVEQDSFEEVGDAIIKWVKALDLPDVTAAWEDDTIWIYPE